MAKSLFYHFLVHSLYQKRNIYITDNFAVELRTVNIHCDINRLLTEREGRTGEYWPEVVAVRTERSEVRTATTEGQYSSVRPEQARLVSGLLYGTVSDSKMQWHSVSDSKMQLQKRFVTESDKSSC